MREQLKRRGKVPDKRLLPTMVRIVSGKLQSLNPLPNNPPAPRTTISADIYRDLGVIANTGAEWLQKRGYAAQAGHALMGVVLCPVLAQRAGLGLVGKSGILITPEHGPRVRLGAIFTSAEFLPFATANAHQWIADYCESCNICVKTCPVGAIQRESADRGSGHVKFVDTEICFPQFADHYGCAVCIGTCPFNRHAYEDLKARHQRRNTAAAASDP